MTIQGRFSATNSGVKFAGLMLAGLLCLRSGGTLFSAQEQDVTLEDIFGLMPQQVVMTAARHPQPVKDSPASITVITADEIRESGATSVPQLLRNVAGLNVVQASAAEWAVTSHQNSEFPATGVLTLLDGRVVYLDIFSVVPWQALPLNMQDIARIEIVKSPSSALWGANAMDGIINIVTKTPSESIGTEVGFQGGDAGERRQFVSHGGQSGPWGYRASAGYSEQAQFHNPILERSGLDTGVRMANGTAQITYSAQEGKQLTLRAGASDGRGEILSPIGHKDREGGLSYVQALQDWGAWRLHGYYNGQDMDVSPFGASKVKARSDIYVVEVQNSTPWAEKHLMTWGFDGRYDRSHAPELIGMDREESRGALFLQEEYKPWESLQLSAGWRYDYFVQIRDFSSGRFGAVWTPLEDHGFRFSAGRSFDKPDAINQYANLATPSNLRELNPALPDVPYTVTVKGNKDIIPARVDALEIGYQNNSFKRITARLDAFLKKQKKGLIAVVTDYYPANAFFPGSPGGVIPSVVSQYNLKHNKTWGGEFGLDWMMRQGLIGFVNYSMQMESGLTIGQNGPLNKANLGARYHVRKLSIYGVAHYVDLRYFQIASQPALPKGSLTAPAYLTVDARLGYRLTPRIELSIAGSNIFNDVHREYADTDYIERRVLGGVTIEF